MSTEQTIDGEPTDGRRRPMPNGHDTTAEAVADLARKSGATLSSGHPPSDEISDEQAEAILRQELRWAMQDAERFETEEEIWTATRYKASGRGFIGIDEAILKSTAWLYRNRPDLSDEQIVERVLTQVREIKHRDAPREHWDWRQERREVEDKLRRYKERLAHQNATMASTGTAAGGYPGRRAPQPPAPPPVGVITLAKTADQFEEQKTEWLWDEHVPLGGLSMFMGQTKVGKSQAGIWLIGRVTTGLPFPSHRIGARLVHEPAEAVLVTGEDAIERAVVPRLKAAGADLRRTHIVQGYAEIQKDGTLVAKRFSLENSLVALSDLLTRRSDIRLVVIDPVNAYLGGKIDAWKNDQVRSVLQPLKELAEKFNVAVVLVHHMRKGQKQGSVLDMSGGSNAFVEAVRAVFAMAQEPGTEEDPAFRGVLTLERASYAKSGHSYVYQIEPYQTGINATTKFVLLENERATMTVGQALEGGKKTEGGGRTPRLEAIDFILGMLGGGDEVLVEEIQKAAKKEEVSFDVVKKLKVDLGIAHRREGFGPGSRMYWRLPADKAAFEAALEKVQGFKTPLPEEMGTQGKEEPSASV